jgi:hypothetical protein
MKPYSPGEVCLEIMNLCVESNLTFEQAQQELLHCLETMKSAEKAAKKFKSASCLFDLS